MAFPTIQTADTKNGTVVSNSNSWTLTYPTNLASGDLILAFVATDGDSVSPSNPTWPAGFSRWFSITSAVSGLVAAKQSDGTETGTFTVTLNASEQGGWRVFRITGWFAGSFPADGTLATQKDGTALSALAAGGASDTPDPPNLDPADWATEDTLWFAACAVDTSRTISVFPLADNQTADVSGGANGATLGLCTANSAVSSLDPGTFTISASDDWRGITVAIRPSGVVVYVPRHPGHDFGSITPG